MNLDSEYQDLVDFFSGRDLPTGPQHINEYSVFLNLSNAVNSRLTQLHSDVAATRKSAALMLREVKDWLTNRDK
ncbi:hypothetical protein GCM10028805_15400 [Spirosoma harenae]